MYCTYFGLDGKPFAITPDPRFLYMSERHREALAHLLYGVGEGGGFVQLTGEVGTGKTTLCRCLLAQAPAHVSVALVLNPRLSAEELVAAVCDDLGVAYEAGTTSLKALVDALNAHLLAAHAAGERTVLVIDEAQDLDPGVLEQVRLLTNLETSQHKLLQVILIGQPELRDMLERPDLRQLAQRITARYHLLPLGRRETRAYIRYRLQVCGGSERLFTAAAVKAVHGVARGIPRLINVVCDRALLGAYVEERTRVTAPIVRRAAAEVLGRSPRSASPRPRRAWALTGAVALLSLGGLLVTAPGLQLPRPPSGGSDRPTVAAAPSEAGSAGARVAPATPQAGAASPGSLAAARKRPAPEPPDPGPPDPGPPDPGAGEPGTSPLAALFRQDPGQARNAAWSGLFDLWQLSFDPRRSPCKQARAQGLRCLRDTGTWSTLRNIGRPAILELVDDDGDRVPVLVTGLGTQRVRLRLGGQSRTLPLDRLRNRWYGDYQVLWRAAIPARLIKPGDRGQAVSWLRRQLDRTLGPEPAPAAPAFFDHKLDERVRVFQRRHALRPDGVVGARTLIQLNTAGGRSGSPRLQVLHSPT